MVRCDRFCVWMVVTTDGTKIRIKKKREFKFKNYKNISDNTNNWCQLNRETNYRLLFVENYITLLKT